MQEIQALSHRDGVSLVGGNAEGVVKVEGQPEEEGIVHTFHAGIAEGVRHHTRDTESVYEADAG